MFYVASQFQGSGKTFQNTFDMSPTASILLGGAIIIFYTMVGGFWAVSLTDSLQGLVMLFTAIVLPVGAFVKIGGLEAFFSGFLAVEAIGFQSFVQDMPLTSGFGLVIGLLGIGLGYPGQPHVVNRFMALRDEHALKRGKQVAIGWAVFVYSGMILLGLCGRIIFPDLADKEAVFLEVANTLFHPVLAGIMVAGILSATMSTADSQLLVAASAIVHDFLEVDSHKALLYSRFVVLFLSLGAVSIALVGSAEIFSMVLFAWTAIGSAFGPILIITLLKGTISRNYSLSAMLVGFTLSVFMFLMPETKGTWLERLLPFICASVIGWLGTKERMPKLD